VRCLPDRNAVQRLMGFPGQMRRCQASCTVPASRVGDQRTVEANAGGILGEARGRDTETCRAVRTASMEGR